MGRGLDGYFFVVPEVGGLCSFEGPRWGVVLTSSVALAWGKHLFPFRTEQLSPTAPMVLGLHGPGRVGRRRFFTTNEPPIGRLVVVLGAFGARPRRRGRRASRHGVHPEVVWIRGVRDPLAELEPEPVRHGSGAVVAGVDQRDDLAQAHAGEPVLERGAAGLGGVTASPHV